MKKVLLIVPLSKERATGQAFGIIDTDEKKILYSHYCSSSGYAYNDLIGVGREGREANLSTLYGEYEIIEDYRNTSFIK